MTTASIACSSLILAEIRQCLFAEIASTKAAATIAMRRDIVTLIAASLGEVIDDIRALEEASAAADRLTRELNIARAAYKQLELQLIARDLERISPSPYSPAGKGRIERLAGRIRRRFTDGGEIIDISDAMWREQMDRARSADRPTDGGAA